MIESTPTTENDGMVSGQMAADLGLASTLALQAAHSLAGVQPRIVVARLILLADELESIAGNLSKNCKQA